MCGRYTQHRPWSELVEIYQITGHPTAVNLPPRYNIAPTQTVPIVRLRSDADERELALVRWGLVPFWAKDATIAYTLINARAETVGEKPAFRQALRKRRCLVVADGFYEWKPEGRGKLPYYITLPDNRPFAFAGLWERWQGAGQDTIDSCTIIVCAASPGLQPIHDRMPVILEPSAFASWLDPRANVAAVRALLQPYGGPLAVVRVSTRVNAVRNDDPACIAPVASGSE